MYANRCFQTPTAGGWWPDDPTNIAILSLTSLIRSAAEARGNHQETGSIKLACLQGFVLILVPNENKRPALGYMGRLTHIFIKIIRLTIIYNILLLSAAP